MADHYIAEQTAILNAELREEEAAAVREKFVKRQEYDSFLLKQMAQKREIAEHEARAPAARTGTANPLRHKPQQKAPLQKNPATSYKLF